MVLNVNIHTRKEIEEIAKNKISKELDFIYKELDKLRNRMNDLETITKMVKKDDKRENYL